DRGRLPAGGLHLAQAPARPGHDPLPLPPPGPPRQHRLYSCRPVRPLDLLRQRLLPGPPATAAARLPPAARGDRPRGPPVHRLGPPLVRPPRLGDGWLELLDARHPRAAGGLRPADRPAARLRLPGGQVAGAVRRRHRDAAPLLHRAAPLARDVALRRDLRRPGARRHRDGGPRAQLLRAPGDPRGPRPAWAVPPASAADRRRGAGRPPGRRAGVRQPGGPVSMDPNPYEVTEPELLRGRRL